MQLIYFRGMVSNFGDDLNTVLWPRLAPALFDGQPAEGFLGIGTIIGMPTPGCRMLHVFSSGAGYDALDTWATPRRVWCVRGPLTAHLLGCKRDVVMTDGAILAPDVLGRPSIGSAGDVVVVPHWESLRFGGWHEASDLAGFRLVSPIDTPASVHSALASARLVLTESLHGAILADTLGIPWTPFVSTRNVSAFKWVDWCLSVGVPFAPVSIAPPSAAAALTFGRPDRGAWGRRRQVDAEAALEEFRSRAAFRARVGTVRSPGLSNRVRKMVREAAQRSTLASRLLGYMPARTAALLAEAAREEGTLSRPTHREELRARMLERLHALAAAHAPQHRHNFTVEAG